MNEERVNCLMATASLLLCGLILPGTASSRSPLRTPQSLNVTMCPALRTSASWLLTCFLAPFEDALSSASFSVLEVSRMFSSLLTCLIRSCGHSVSILRLALLRSASASSSVSSIEMTEMDQWSISEQTNHWHQRALHLLSGAGRDRRLTFVSRSPRHPFFPFFSPASSSRDDAVLRRVKSSGGDCFGTSGCFESTRGELGNGPL